MPEALHDRAADNWRTLLAIADVAGCSVRALQLAFRRFRGSTPMAALQRIRLDEARTEMMRADRAQSLFNMGGYRGSSARLWAIAWSAESLRAEIGAETDRDRLGDHLAPYRLARELTLFAATSARVAAIDGIFPNIRDLEGLRAEALAARRDGFVGKLAVDVAQAAVINDVFPQGTAPVDESGV